MAELNAMKLKEAAKKVEDGIEETLTYCDFPGEHWYQQRDRAAEPRDPPQNPRGVDISGWQLRPDAGGRGRGCATWRAPSGAAKNT